MLVSPLRRPVLVTLLTLAAGLPAAPAHPLPLRAHHVAARRPRGQPDDRVRGAGGLALGRLQPPLFEALATGDPARVSEAREELERLGLLRELGRRGAGRRPT